MRNQLTENAAKAAGFIIDQWACYDDSGREKLYVRDRHGYHSCFNPLNEDEDAFRLAMRMSIEVRYDRQNGIVHASRDGAESKQYYSISHNHKPVDIMTEEFKKRAAREAITQVAAHFVDVPFIIEGVEAMDE